MSTPAATAAGRRRASARSPRSKSAASKPARRQAPKTSRRKPPSRSGRSRRLSLSSWRAWLIVLPILAGALAIAYFTWFRHSSFVAVQDVKVEGATTPDRDRITAALTDAADGMTTLDVDASRLASAVSGFPTVASVTADPSFPHGLTVHVTEHAPALVATDGQRRVAVAADGSLLPTVDAHKSSLPLIHVDSLPSGGRLGGEPLAEAQVIAAAPAPLQPLVEGVSTTRDYGIVVTLRRGIRLRFGSASKPQAKWASSSAVLADQKVTSLDYVDVRVPARPAIGG